MTKVSDKHRSPVRKRALVAVLLVALAAFLHSTSDVSPSGSVDTATEHTEEVQCNTSIKINMACALNKSLQATGEGLAAFKGPFLNFFYSVRSNTVFCTPPKVASTTFRLLLRDIENLWDGTQIRNSSEDIHGWFFQHAGILEKMSSDRRTQLLTNSSIRKIAFFRDPEERFLSGVFNRGHKALGRQRYNSIGCVGADTDNGSPCWKAGYNSTLELQEAVFNTLIRRNNNDHFRQQTDICGFGRVPYDSVYQVHELPALLDGLCHERVDPSFNCKAFVEAARQKYLTSKPNNPSFHARPNMPSVLCEETRKFARVYKDDLALGQC